MKRTTVTSEVQVLFRDLDAKLLDELVKLERRRQQIHNDLQNLAGNRPEIIMAKELSVKWSPMVVQGHSFKMEFDAVVKETKPKEPEKKRLNYPDPKTLNTLLNGKLLKDFEKRELLYQHGYLLPPEKVDPVDPAKPDDQMVMDDKAQGHLMELGLDKKITNEDFYQEIYSFVADLSDAFYEAYEYSGVSLLVPETISGRFPKEIPFMGLEIRFHDGDFTVASA